MNVDAAKFKKFYCNRFLLDLKFCPLENNFAPLATHSEIPILAGETLYPSSEHYIAAQLFRDVGRLEASKNVPKIRSQQLLRQYVRAALAEIDKKVVNDWRHTKMLSSLKTATQMKFSQYTELKALLIQTGGSILIETNESDIDWGIGMSYEKLKTWMKDENLNVLSVAFWLMHCDFKPGLLGANLTGRLLMTLRNEFVMELDKDLKPKIDSDVCICQICANLEQCGQMYETELDEIMFINALNSVLAFNYPSRFLLDGKIYSSVENYVQQQINDAGTVKLLKSFDNRSVENELYVLYQNAIGANLQQSRFSAEALLRTKNALLVDVRPSIERNNPLVRHLATSLGSFDGDFNDFINYVNRNGLNSQTLARWWLTKDVPLLKSIGKNRLGLLMMKFREKLMKNEIHPLTDDTFWSSFRPSWTTATKFGLLQALIKTPNFITSNKINVITKIAQTPLSKFYCCLFTLEKTDFISLEHYFWWRRMLNVATRGFLRKILSSNTPSELKDLCEIYLASNTPVVDEDQISDTDIYEFGCLEKFQQNCSLCSDLVEDLSLLVDGTDVEMEAFENCVRRWAIPAKLLLRWWLNDEDFQKPNFLPDNAHGLTLMKIRQTFLNKYFDSYFTDDNFSIEDISRLSVNFQRIDKRRFYVFSDDSCLSFRSRLTSFSADGDDYYSIFHFYWSKCLEQLGFLTESKSLLSVESEYDCQKLVDELFESFSLHSLYEKWQVTEGITTLKTGLEFCVESNKKFRNFLLETAGLTLIYDSADEKWGIGMPKDDFCKLINELNLNAESFLMLYKDLSCKPKCLGRNAWAFALMETREEVEKVDKIDREETNNVELDQNCFFEIGSFPVLERQLFDNAKAVEVKQCKISTQCVWDTLAEPFVGNMIKTETFTSEKPTEVEQKAEDILDKKRVALLNACRQCFPNFTDMAALLKNEKEAYELGQKFAQTFQQLFGDDFDQAVKVLNVEDLHTLGRIAGFEQNIQ